MAEQTDATRTKRKIRMGVVTSDKMEKTVTVSLVRRYARPPGLREADHPYQEGKGAGRPWRQDRRYGADHGDETAGQDGQLAGYGDRGEGEVRSY